MAAVDIPDPLLATLLAPLMERVGGGLATVILQIAGRIADDRERGYMDKDEACAYLKLGTQRTLENWMKPVSEGGRGLPHIKLGETVRFSRARIDAWALTHEKNPPPLLRPLEDAA